MKNTFTAPVFRSRPSIEGGFLHGNYWKYSAKPSNILPTNNQNNEDGENEGQHTIQDDVVVAGQDVAAGLVRMGILPRICYLLEVSLLYSLSFFFVRYRVKFYILQKIIKALTHHIGFIDILYFGTCDCCDIY